MIPADLPIIEGQATLAVRTDQSLGGYMARLLLASGHAYDGWVRVSQENPRDAIIVFDVPDAASGVLYEVLLIDPNGEERMLRTGQLVIADSVRLEPGVPAIEAGTAVSTPTTPMPGGDAAMPSVRDVFSEQTGGAPRNVFVQADDPGEQPEPWVWFQINDDGSLHTLWTGAPE